MMMQVNQFHLLGWLVIATVLLSLVGLTAEPMQHHAMTATQLPS